MGEAKQKKDSLEKKAVLMGIPAGHPSRTAMMQADKGVERKTVGRPKKLAESVKIENVPSNYDLLQERTGRSNWFTDASKDKEAIKVLEDIAIAGLCGNEIDFKLELEKIKAILSK